MSDSYLVASEVCKSKESAALTYWSTTPLNETAPHVGNFSNSLIALDSANDVAYKGITYFNSNTLGFSYVAAFTPETYHKNTSSSDSATSDRNSLDSTSTSTSSGSSVTVVPKHVTKSRESAEALKKDPEYYIPQGGGHRLYPLCLKNVTSRHDRIGSSNYWISTHGNFKHRKTITEQEKMFSSSKSVPDVASIDLDSLDREPDPLLYYTASPKYIPLSYGVVTRVGTSSDISCDSQPPTTSVFDQFKAKLLENDAKDALRSMISRPAVVDGASLLTLVNSMLLTHGSSFRDVYPMLTCLLVLNSLDNDLSTTTGDWAKMVRQVGTDSDVIAGIQLRTYNAQGDVPEIKVGYVSLSRFMQTLAGTYNESAASIWHRSKFDQSWIAIPVTSELLTMGDPLGYIMAHAHSDYWAGRIAWWKIVTLLTEHDNIEDVDYFSGQSFIPAAASVCLPGPRNILLVQMIGSSSTIGPDIYCKDTKITFTSDNAVNIQTTDLRDAWRLYFTNENIPALRLMFYRAYHLILNRNTIGDSAGRAIFLASEISSKTPPGLGLQPKSNGSGYDTSKAVRGLWTCVAQKWGQEDWQASNWFDGCTIADHVKMDERISGFNFSMTSPLGVCPVSYAEVGLQKFVPNVGAEMQLGFWKSAKPTFLSAPNYVVQMAGSLNRLAAVAHLLETHPINGPYHFCDVASPPMFCAHLASALAGSLAVFLLQNDIEYRHWVGWDALEHRGFYATLTEIKRLIFLGQVNNTSPATVRDPANTINFIEKYYGVSYADSMSFMICTPYATCCTVQWADKVESQIADANAIMASTTLGGKRIVGVRIEESWGIQKAMMTGFVNDESAKPVVFVLSGEEEKPFYQEMWVENLGTSTYFQSRQDLQLAYAPSEILNKPVLSTLTYTRAFKSPLEFDSIPTLQYITSGLMGVPKGKRRIRASPIVLPDPFSLDSFLDWVRDYVAKPALSAGKEFLTTGSIPQAGLAAGKEIEKQMDRREQQAAQLAAQERMLEREPKPPALPAIPPDSQIQVLEETSHH